MSLQTNSGVRRHSVRLSTFSIGKDLIPREMITAYAILKKGAANRNYAGKRLDQRHKLGSGYEGMFVDDLNGQTFLPGQANNFYIFPAVGMAIFATQAKRVTDEMFIQAGQAGLLYPLQSNILETEIQTAARVAKPVFDSGPVRIPRPAVMVAFIRDEHVYKPEYSNEALRAGAAA